MRIQILILAFLAFVTVGCELFEENNTVAPEPIAPDEQFQIGFSASLAPPLAATQGSPAKPCTISATPSIRGGVPPHKCEWAIGFDPLSQNPDIPNCGRIDWFMASNFGAGGFIFYNVLLKVSDSSGAELTRSTTEAFDCTGTGFTFGPA